MTKHGGLVQNPLCWLEHKCRNIVVDWKICSTQKCQLSDQCKIPLQKHTFKLRDIQVKNISQTIAEKDAITLTQ